MVGIVRSKGRLFGHCVPVSVSVIVRICPVRYVRVVSLKPALFATIVHVEYMCCMLCRVVLFQRMYAAAARGSKLTRE